MLVRTVRNAVLALLIALPISVSSAASVEIDLLAATPVGSWAMSEDLETDHRGRQTVKVLKYSMLGTEQRDGDTHYWLEVVIDRFALKNGKRKKQGDRFVFKALVGEAALKGDLLSVTLDWRDNSEELIIQTGDGQPIRISGHSGVADVFMESLWAGVTLTFGSAGLDAVTVPAGTFHTEKLLLSSSTEVQAYSTEVTVTNTTWYTPSVPFGVVKVEGRTIINGDVSTNTTRLLDYGISGAHSLITSPPQELPPMPTLPAPFGG